MRARDRQISLYYVIPLFRSTITNLFCTYVAEFPKATPVIQQSLCRIFGDLAYRNHPDGAAKALTRLLDTIDAKVVYTRPAVVIVSDRAQLVTETLLEHRGTS